MQCLELQYYKVSYMPLAGYQSWISCTDQYFYMDKIQDVS